MWPAGHVVGDGAGPPRDADPANPGDEAAEKAFPQQHHGQHEQQDDAAAAEDAAHPETATPWMALTTEKLTSGTTMTAATAKPRFVTATATSDASTAGNTIGASRIIGNTFDRADRPQPKQ